LVNKIEIGKQTGRMHSDYDHNDVIRDMPYDNIRIGDVYMEQKVKKTDDP
jgi:hypothetical protein